MLVLTRKAGEEIAIGDAIRITVRVIDGNRVSLGVTAPPGVRVLRAELLDREPKQEGGDHAA